MGLTNVRPMKWYGYLYPFLPKDLHDIAYYFDFEYATPIDNGGYLTALHDAVATWQQRRDHDHLRAYPYGDGMLITDTRPVAVAAQTLLNQVERLVLETCDQISTVRRVQQILSSRLPRQFSDGEVREILDRLAARHFILREEERFLSLPVLTYKPVQPDASRHSLNVAEIALA